MGLCLDNCDSYLLTFASICSPLHAAVTGGLNLIVCLQKLHVQHELVEITHLKKPRLAVYNYIFFHI